MTAAATAPGERARPEWIRTHPRGWIAAVGTVCFGAFMGQLDASVVALTYHSIGHEYGATLGTVQWVTLSYLVTLGLLLVPLGRLSDRLGRKRVYIWGFGLFTVASAGCAAAPSLAALVAVRAVQGVGAAMLQANSVAIVSTAAPRSRLRFALGVQAAAQALGLALGPTVGGIIVATVGWRWVFAINVPVGVVAMVAARFFLPRTRFSGAGRSTVRGVPRIARGLFGASLAYLLLFGPMVLVPAVLQQRGATALHAGLVAAALPVGFALGATVGGRLLPRRWSVARRCLAGLGLTAAGLGGLLAVLPAALPTAAALLAAGLGLGLFTPLNNAQIMTAAPAPAAALAGGLVSASRAAGTAAGTAVVAGLLGVDGSGRWAAAALIGAAAFAVVSLSPSRS